MKVTYVIITHNRAEDLKDLLSSIQKQDWNPFEIIIVDNASTDDTPRMITEVQKNIPSLQYIRTDENLGVSGGRNLAISKSTGDVMVTIDDDAVFADNHSICRLVEFFQGHPEIGILAFKILDYYSGEIIKEQFPTRKKKRDPNIGFETSWFIGAGHAIRREVYGTIGLYNDYNPYGSEELDFAFRALDASFRIWYMPSVCVYHKISPKGRMADQTNFKAILLRHRIRVAMLNLPWIYVATHVVIWSLAYLFLFSKFNIRILISAYQSTFQNLQAVLDQRKPIKAKTIRRINHLGGQIWY